MLAKEGPLRFCLWSHRNWAALPERRYSRLEGRSRRALWENPCW